MHDAKMILKWRNSMYVGSDLNTVSSWYGQQKRQ